MLTDTTTSTNNITIADILYRERAWCENLLALYVCLNTPGTHLSGFINNFSVGVCFFCSFFSKLILTQRNQTGNKTVCTF